MDLLRGPLEPGTHPAMEIALAHALLHRTSRGEAGAVLRVYRPASPVVAFSRRDTLLPGFPDAVRAARGAGFTPVVRPQGGRAVAYTDQAVIADHVSPHPTGPSGMDERFATFGKLWADVLGEYGVAARVGAVAGEYCPGAYSVNARGEVKLVGTAQRLVRRAWLFSAVAVYDDAETLRPLLTTIYRHLELPFDAASVGTVRAEAAGLTLDALATAVVERYRADAGDDGMVVSVVEPAVRRHAEELLRDHVVS